ncbi:myo-inosose-2 dehydratase [Lactococcus ileimucosae]|uniref:myo-inosose-2 dehydratase n=1 Tax=Lactococcus ileimucosae TaxID=2941329 RepID=UPI0035114997
MTITLGICPIGWTNDDLPELGAENTFQQALSEMALAGFTGTEIGNKYPKNPVELHSHLEPRGMSIASGWFSAFLTTKPFEETAKAFKLKLDFLHAMGSKVIVVSEQGHSIQCLDKPIYDEKPTFSEEEWHLVTTGLEKLGSMAHERGMEIVFHHHMGTCVQTTAEIERLMDYTHPDKVSLLFDTGHLVFSGEDPLYIYNKYANRIKHIHFKDIREDRMNSVKLKHSSFLQGVKDGVFTVPGDGMIDFEPIWHAIHTSDYQGWIMVEAEQDPTQANPFLYAQMAREYMNQVTGL